MRTAGVRIVESNNITGLRIDFAQSGSYGHRH
jgi:hypothetical protein